MNQIRGVEDRPGGTVRTAQTSDMIGDSAWARLKEGLGLSPRELQLVQGVFEDQTEGAIADDLGLSPHTVHTYFERLHRKLGVRNRVQLILRVTQEYLAMTR